MFKVMGVRYLSSDSIGSGQIPQELTLLIDTLNDEGEHIFCIRMHTNEFDDDLVYIGGYEMCEAWERAADEASEDDPMLFDEVDDAAYVVLEYSDGVLTNGAEEPEYASLVRYSAGLMSELIEAGRCEVLIGEVLD